LRVTRNKSNKLNFKVQMSKNIIANNNNLAEIEKKYEKWDEVAKKQEKFVYHKTSYDVVLKKEKNFTKLERVARIFLGVIGTIGTGGALLFVNDFRKLFWKEKRSVQIGIPSEISSKIKTVYNNAQMSDRLAHLDTHFSLIQKKDPALCVNSINECLSCCTNFEEYERVFNFIEKHSELGKNQAFKESALKALMDKFFKGDDRWEKSCTKEQLNKFINFFGVFVNLSCVNVESAVNACAKFIDQEETTPDQKIKMFQFIQLIINKSQSEVAKTSQENLNKASHLILTHLKSLPETEKELNDSCELLAIKQTLSSVREGVKEAELADIYQSLVYYFSHLESFRDDKESNELVSQFILGRNHGEKQKPEGSWISHAESTALNISLEPENIKKTFESEERIGILTLDREKKFLLINKHFDQIKESKSEQLSLFFTEYLEYKKKQLSECVTAINIIVEQEQFFKHDAKSKAAGLFLRLIHIQGSDFQLSEKCFSYFGNYFFNNPSLFSAEELLQSSLYFIRSDKSPEHIRRLATLSLLTNTHARILPSDHIKAAIFAFSTTDLEQKYYIAATKTCLKNIRPNSKEIQNSDNQKVFKKSQEYFYANINKFADDKETRELFAENVLQSVDRSPTQWINRSLTIASELIQESDELDTNFKKNRDRKLLFSEYGMPRFLLHTAPAAMLGFLQRCLNTGLEYTQNDRVLSLIAKNHHSFGDDILCPSAKLQLKWFSKMNLNGKNTDTINFYGLYIFHNQNKFTQGELLQASKIFLSWGESTNEIRLKAAESLIENTKEGMPSSALVLALGVVFQNRNDFADETLILATALCLKYIPLTSWPKEKTHIPNLSLHYFFSHLDLFKNSPEIEKRVALFILKKGSVKLQWIEKSLEIATTLMIDKTDEKNISDKLAFCEICLPQLMNKAPVETLEFLEKCLSREDQFRLSAINSILTYKLPNEVFIEKAISIASDLLLKDQIVEGQREEELARIVASCPTLFKEEVIEKANLINFWKDPTKFTVQLNTYNIFISLGLLKKFPEKVLNKIFRDCFSKSPAAPGIWIKYLNDTTLANADGFDAGGLSRSFFADLFQSLTEKAVKGSLVNLQFGTTKSGCLPIHKNTTNIYTTLNIFTHLTDDQIYEALEIAFGLEENVPLILKDVNENIDLAKVKEHFPVVQKAMSLLSLAEQETYVTIGKLMGFCVTSTKKLLIGQVFNPVVYQVLAAIPLDELGKSFSELNDETLLKLYRELLTVTNKDEKRFAFFDHDIERLTLKKMDEIMDYAYYDEDEKPAVLRGNPDETIKRDNFALVLQDIKAQLLEDAKQNSTLAAIYSMALGIASHVGKDLKVIDAKILEKAVQGEFSPELLKESIECDNITIKEFFLRWIEENKDDTILLKKLLYTITGSDSLATGIKLHINMSLATKEARPVAHTCFGSLDVYPYPDYEMFKARLEEAIANSASGFQIG
jgi:hypothetical protein